MQTMKAQRSSVWDLFLGALVVVLSGVSKKGISFYSSLFFSPHSCITHFVQLLEHR